MEQELKPEDISKTYNEMPNTDFKNVLTASMLNQMNWYIQYELRALKAQAPTDLDVTTEFENEILDEGENV